MSIPAAGQLPTLSNSHHQPSNMTAVQAQEYCDLVVAKAEQLGPHYVERQLTWGAAELDRLHLQQVRPGGPFVIQCGLQPEAAQEGGHVDTVSTRDPRCLCGGGVDEECRQCFRMGEQG